MHLLTLHLFNKKWYLIDFSNVKCVPDANRNLSLQGTEWVLAKKSEHCVMPSLLGDGHGLVKELLRALVNGFV